jgi:hypothetical protein
LERMILISFWPEHVFKTIFNLLAPDKFVSCNVQQRSNVAVWFLWLQWNGNHAANGL